MKHQSVFPHQWFTSAMQSIRFTTAKLGNSEAGDIRPGHGLDGNHGLTCQGCHPFYAGMMEDVHEEQMTLFLLALLLDRGRGGIMFNND